MFFDKDFKEIMYTQVIALGGGLLAGVMLAFWTDKLLIIPGLLVIFPGFLEMRGNISGSLAGRLIVDLHLKKLKPALKLKNNVMLKK